MRVYVRQSNKKYPVAYEVENTQDDKNLAIGSIFAAFLIFVIFAGIVIFSGIL